MTWQIFFSKDSRKDAVKLRRAGLQGKADILLDLLEKDPFASYPPYEKLVGELEGFYSRRVNIQHRLIYQVDKKNRRVFVERMWTHYE